MAFDFRKEYPEFYLPPRQPQIVQVPKMRFIAVRGHGDPNKAGGSYQQAIEVLYGIAYTIKMSRRGDHRMAGYFDYVVPPLEGFWQQEGIQGMDYSRKDLLEWISVIRLPDFVSEPEFQWARQEAARKKKKDFSAAEFLEITEGECVQCMHVGPYDAEPKTVAAMDAYAAAAGYAVELSEQRRHHEIYLTDARRTAPEKWKTVIRHPVRRIG
jgi:hypothetical protein